MRASGAAACCAALLLLASACCVAAGASGAAGGGHFIIIFRPGVNDISRAFSRLLAEVDGALELLRGATVSAAAATSTGTSGDTRADETATTDALQLLHDLSSPPALKPNVAVAAAAAARPQQAARGVQGVVVAAPSDAVPLMLRSSLVAAVLPDIEVTAQIVSPRQDTGTFAGCVAAQALSQGVPAPSNADDVAWAGCLSDATRLVWTGRRCGAGLGRVAYTTLYALSRKTGAVARSPNGAECVLTANSAKQDWGKYLFGGCGESPAVAASLPNVVCPVVPGSCLAAAAASDSRQAFVSRMRLAREVQCGGQAVSVLSYSGIACGPTSEFVRWTKAVGPGGCVLTPGRGAASSRANTELFGSCGVPPGLAVSPPSTVCRQADAGPGEPDTTHVLPRADVEQGEGVPPGLLQVEAVSANGRVVDASRLLPGLPASRQVVVGVMDSGVDESHEDVNYVGGTSFLAASAGAGAEDPAYDGFGHGTHIAGIVGARNNGAGVVGVSAGVGVYSLKVLDANGRGTLSGILAAVKWVARNGPGLGIRVVNLSVAAFVDPNTPGYASAYKSACGYLQEASDAGVLMVASAGNDGADMRGYFPAACPSVLTVAALDGNRPSSYSNWMPASASAADRAHILAAPGTLINSTVPAALFPSGYKELSGTSTAAPHVAGIAANCILSGACGAAGVSGTTHMAVVVGAALARRSVLPAARFGYAGDVNGTRDGRWYGMLAWSKF